MGGKVRVQQHPAGGLGDHDVWAFRICLGTIPAPFCRILCDSCRIWPSRPGRPSTAGLDGSQTETAPAAMLFDGRLTRIVHHFYADRCGPLYVSNRRPSLLSCPASYRRDSQPRRPSAAAVDIRHQIPSSHHRRGGDGRSRHVSYPATRRAKSVAPLRFGEDNADAGPLGRPRLGSSPAGGKSSSEMMRSRYFYSFAAIGDDGSSAVQPRRGRLFGRNPAAITRVLAQHQIAQQLQVFMPPTVTQPKQQSAGDYNKTGRYRARSDRRKRPAASSSGRQRQQQQ
ncbi:hypothetical protein DAPPUDRAFT_108558 [Daphnia pulex]|uniref:Uncharacterized protein n=1 Tax=Daphnia pulex TaxID=6669 RepID=E9H0I8_DAPPU|nr:hypothetical protein DAPPUDRAFT_108558 [Daphnia pulex]|eukprot:EFX74654.1 hypothetical protein DAPPUDRAFT_108558 [Daphnia pulex]